jgi:hypothetical protein
MSDIVDYDAADFGRAAPRGGLGGDQGGGTHPYVGAGCAGLTGRVRRHGKEGR